MTDRPANGSAPADPPFADIESATRRLMAALDALESSVERRRDADRDEDELATRIQALGADRSRLADELDSALVKARRLERANREIAERLDGAIGTIRAVLDGKDDGAAGDEHHAAQAAHDAPAEGESVEHLAEEHEAGLDEEEDEAPHLDALNDEEDEDEEEEEDE